MPHHHRPAQSLLLLIVFALVFGGCAETPPAQPPTATPRPRPPVTAIPPTATPAPEEAYTPRFEEADCPFGDLGEQIRCGYLVVPENRAQPAERQVELAVAILAAKERGALPDPIIYLEGGPGGSALVDPTWWFASPLRARRDIVLLDQRGTGFSRPSLNCNELEEEYDDAVEAAEQCADRLRDEGIDLAHYNSVATALDVRDLRIALDYPEINLVGISYGTRVALTVLREAPEGIRSVVLDGPYPPHVDAYAEYTANAVEAILGVLRACAADNQCNQAFPDLESDLPDIIAELNDNPALVELEDSETGEDLSEEYNGDDLVDAIFDWLYDTNAIPYIPLMLAEVREGEYQGALADLVIGISPPGADDEKAVDPPEIPEELGDISDSEGAFYSVECHEEVAFTSPTESEKQRAELLEELAEPIQLSADETLATCEVWGAGRADREELRMVRSDIPTLILAGEFDPITPPAWGRRAARGLSNSYFFTVPGGGHAVMDSSACSRAIVQAFIEDPATAPDAGCLDEMRVSFKLR